MKWFHFFWVIVICFLCACTRETASWSAGDPMRVEIDESALIIQSTPSQIRKINDSIVAMVINRSQLALYDLYTGENVRSYSAEIINFDSLLNVTYNHQYKGRRQYVYDSSSAGGLTDGKYQMFTYYFTGAQFYIYVNAQVEVKYIDDTIAFKKRFSGAQMKAISEKYKNANFHFMEWVEFIFIVDRDLKLQKILPQYERSSFAGQYSPAFQSGFAIDKTDLYAAIAPVGLTLGKIDANKDTPGLFYSIAKLNIQDEKALKLLFSNEELDFSPFSYLDRYFSERFFKNSEEGLLFSNGKEIWSVEKNTPLMKGEKLRDNEWINSFYVDKEQLLLTTYTLDKKAYQPGMAEGKVPDTISSYNVIRIDRKMDTMALKKLNLMDFSRFDVDRNNVIYVERDKEHYYLTHIPLNEK